MFPDTFPLIQIFVPLVAFAIVILCCASLCKTLQRVRREHLESQAQARILDNQERPSIFIIPFSPPEEELHRPPVYNAGGQYSPPPPYHELEFKPDFIPRDPPPAYTESIPPPPTDFTPARSPSPEHHEDF